MRKKIVFLSVLVFFSAWLVVGQIKAQTVADFEDLTLTTDSYWNGSDSSGFFISGNASFVNKFTDWGGGVTSWSGFSYTNKRDTTTQSYTNEFSAITAMGYGSSDNYAVGYVSAFDPLPRIRLNGIAQADTVGGFFITNSTYSYLTMKNGGGMAKKFGGVSGEEPDWFVLAVYGYKDGIRKADSVLFYLADFRFTASAQDYIVNDWQWVDLTSLGRVDSVEFNLFSSDIAGGFGINNPTYFCMDNLITNHHSFSDVHEIFSEALAVYPNPAEDWIVIKSVDENSRIRVFDLMGRQMPELKMKDEKIDVSGLSSGLYLIEIHNGNAVFYSKFEKK